MAQSPFNPKPNPNQSTNNSKPKPIQDNKKDVQEKARIERETGYAPVNPETGKAQRYDIRTGRYVDTSYSSIEQVSKGGAFVSQGGSSNSGGGGSSNRSSSTVAPSVSSPFAPELPQSKITKPTLQRSVAYFRDSPFLPENEQPVFSPVRPIQENLGNGVTRERRFGTLAEAKNVQTGITREQQQQRTALKERTIAQQELRALDVQREREAQKLKGSTSIQRNIKAIGVLGTSFTLDVAEQKPSYFFGAISPVGSLAVKTIGERKVKTALSSASTSFDNRYVSPTVSKTNVNVGFGLFTGGLALAPVSAGSTARLSLIGTGFLIPEIADQARFEGLDRKRKDIILSKREEIKTAVARATQKEEEQYTGVSGMFSGISFVQGLASIPTPITGKTGIGLRSVDKQIQKGNLAYSQSISFFGFDPTTQVFLEKQKTTRERASIPSDILGGVAFNQIGGDLFRLGSRKLAEGTLRQTATGVAVKTAVRTAPAGSGEAIFQNVRDVSGSQQEIKGSSLFFDALTGGASSGILGGIISGGDVFATAGRKATQRVTGKVVSGVSYTGGSLLSPEESFADILSEGVSSRRSKVFGISFSGKSDTNIKASLIDLSATPTTTRTQTKSVKTVDQTLGLFAETETGKKFKVGTINFSNIFGGSVSRQSSFSLTGTPSEMITETQTQTPTQTTTTTPTRTNTFQNFLAPILPDFNVPSSKGGRTARERKGYYDELTYALNFGGLNLAGSKLPPVKKQKGVNKNVFGL